LSISQQLSDTHRTSPQTYELDFRTSQGKVQDMSVVLTVIVNASLLSDAVNYE